MGLVSPFDAPHGSLALEIPPPGAPGSMITTPARVVGFSMCEAVAHTPTSVLPRTSSLCTPPSRQSSLTEALLSQPSLVPRLRIKVKGAKGTSQQPRRHSSRPAHPGDSSDTQQQQLCPRRTASALLLTTQPGRGGEGMHLPRCPTASLEIPRLHRTLTCPSVFAEDIVEAALHASSPYSSAFSSFSSLSTTAQPTSCLAEAGPRGLTPRRLGAALPADGPASATAAKAAAAAAAPASSASSPSAASSLHSWCGGGGGSSSQHGLLYQHSPQQLLAAAEMQRAEAARRLFEAQAAAATAQAQAQTLREALRKERAQVEQLEAELARMKTERDELLLQAQGCSGAPQAPLLQYTPFGQLASSRSSSSSRRGRGNTAQPALRVSFKDSSARVGAGGGHASQASAGLCEGAVAALAGACSPPTPDAEHE